MSQDNFIITRKSAVLHLCGGGMRDFGYHGLSERSTAIAGDDIEIEVVSNKQIKISIKNIKHSLRPQTAIGREIRTFITEHCTAPEDVSKFLNCVNEGQLNDELNVIVEYVYNGESFTTEGQVDNVITAKKVNSTIELATLSKYEFWSKNKHDNNFTKRTRKTRANKANDIVTIISTQKHHSYVIKNTEMFSSINASSNNLSEQINKLTTDKRRSNEFLELLSLIDTHYERIQERAKWPEKIFSKQEHEEALLPVVITQVEKIVQCGINGVKDTAFGSEAKKKAIGNDLLITIINTNPTAETIVMEIFGSANIGPQYEYSTKVNKKFVTVKLLLELDAKPIRQKLAAFDRMPEKTRDKLKIDSCKTEVVGKRISGAMKEISLSTMDHPAIECISDFIENSSSAYSAVAKEAGVRFNAK